MVGWWSILKIRDNHNEKGFKSVRHLKAFFIITKGVIVWNLKKRTIKNTLYLP